MRARRLARKASVSRWIARREGPPLGRDLDADATMENPAAAKEGSEAADPLNKAAGRLAREGHPQA